VSARREQRAGGRPGHDGSVVPARLRRYDSAFWGREGDEEPMLDAHRRWREARVQWAREHGYDLEAKAGEAPDRDWWAFLAACQPERLQPAGRKPG
jgi:hypothetical protein